MMELSRDLRDRAVWVLARLSLATMLAVMAALFIGSAAEGGTPTDSTTVVEEPASHPSQEGMLEDANPVGLVLLGVVVAGGLGVLTVGAVLPSRRRDTRELSEILRN